MVVTGFPSGRVADVSKKEARTCGSSSLCVLAQGDSVLEVDRDDNYCKWCTWNIVSSTFAMRKDRQRFVQGNEKSVRL
jgi:hypothetical protein